MTPQLQQAIRLLQLSTLDLQTEIQQTLEENPLLELDEDLSPAEQSKEQSETDIAAGDQQIDLETRQDIPEDMPVDTKWEDIYDITTASAAGGQAASDSNNDFLENQSVAGNSLAEHLLWQLQNTPISDNDLLIAIAIIDGINDDGYLTESLEDIHQSLREDIDIDFDEVEAVLHRIQHMDPLGVGARDLKECLLLQLETYDSQDPMIADVRMLISEHLDLLGLHDYARLQRKTRRNQQELQQLIQFIQTLNPRPGSLISGNTAEYIVPDIYVRKVKGEWVVELNHEAAPKIRINEMYARHIRGSGRSKDGASLRNSLQEARWFLKSLQSRHETLYRVGNAIVQRQRLFLEHGAEGMKPMVLRDIAEELDMHESTISRVTTQKYMHTPRGVFEFKFFFSSHVSTADGGECSATAIRAMIKKLIDNENPQKPLSDNKISGFLVKEGINVARRTVAKYRESMSIPPSNERKRLA